jgi:hypothetical protein
MLLLGFNPCQLNLLIVLLLGKFDVFPDFLLIDLDFGSVL